MPNLFRHLIMYIGDMYGSLLMVWGADPLANGQHDPLFISYPSP
jgi:hypothetical protein